LDSERESGTVYVLIDRDMARHTGDTPNDRPGESSALISQMQDRIGSLERQLEHANDRDREHRRIIAALTSRIPQLEAPRGPTEDAETVDEAPERAEPRSDAPGPQTTAQSRPWWRRFFQKTSGS
jgi:hypothetical protein